MTREEIERRINHLDKMSSRLLNQMYNKELSKQEREDAKITYYFVLGELHILKILLEKGE